MTFTKYLLAAAATLGLSTSAFAQGYSTTFNQSEGYNSAAPLSGQLGWETNDPYVGPPKDAGQADYVGPLSGYSNGPTDYWALLGGLAYVPGSPEVNLWHSFNLVGATTFDFDVDFSIVTGSLDNIRDTFGWTFRDAADTTLFSLRFDPAGDVNNEQYTIRFYNSLGVEQIASGSGSFNLFDNQIYHLDVSVDAAGLADVTITNLSGPPNYTPGTSTMVITDAPTGLIGPAIATIENVAATWILEDPTPNLDGAYEGAGENSLAFNNYSAVPEPATGLLLLGGLAALGMRRRR